MFSLAESVGVLDVNRLFDTITAKQFDEWEAYKRIEPDKLDRLREIITRGLQCLCNSWGAKLEMKDLDPWHEDPEPESLSPAEVERRMKEVY